MTTGDIARLLGAAIDGRDDLFIARVDAIDCADGQTLTFIRDDKFARQWATSKAAAAVAPAGLEIPGHDPAARAIIRVREPDVALTLALDAIQPEPPAPAPGVHASANVHPSASIDPSAHVGPMCVIGAGATIGAGAALLAGCVIGPGAVIGRRTLLHPRVCVLDRCVIGDECILHAGVVIGGDGFGYRPSPDGKGLVKLPHRGNVVVGSRVEIGANSTVDRARFGSTTIGDGTKIDNLVQIGHNCRIGRSCIICGCCGIAGSVTIGDGVMLGGGVGIGDNLTLGNGSRIVAMSAAACDIPAGETWAGLPARPGKEYMRMLGAMRKAAGV